MRILYLDYDASHINPTFSLARELFNFEGHALTSYGPGFVGPATLQGGISRFYESHGGFDVVAFGPGIPVMSGADTRVESTISYANRFTSLGSRVRELRDFLDDALATLPKLEDAIKLYCGLNWDYYAATRKGVDDFAESNLYFLGPGAEFVRAKTAVPDSTANEPHFRRKQEELSDCWREFLLANGHRVISSVHFVTDNEFFDTPLKDRVFDYAVPGVPYVDRKIAARILRDAGSLSQARNSTAKIMRGLGRRPLYAFRSTRFQNEYRRRYRRTLSDSRACFLSSDGFGEPVRKFFEVPAAGALPFGVPCEGATQLGFVHLETFLDAAEFGLTDSVVFAASDPRAQEIATRAQRHVRLNHSLDARREHVRRALELISDNDYAGSRWEAGRFEASRRTHL